MEDKKVLMIAFHYPPFGTSSGMLRTLKFSRYLVDLGWKPIVLTVHPRAYQFTRDDLIDKIPEHVMVKRVAALDTARHLSIRGAYPQFFAWPDRWSSWWLSAVPTGIRIIREHRPSFLWSTYPIATAHLIGLTIQRVTGLKWIADFRDPMVEDGFPPAYVERKFYEWIENETVKKAVRCVFTTPGALRKYKEKYSECPVEKWSLIPNGYDEEDFEKAERTLPCPRPIARRRLDLVHSGTLYRSERDPSAFFQALSELKYGGAISADNLKVIFRGSGHDIRYGAAISKAGIDDIVSFEPNVEYEQALSEILQADGLLVFQASNCNDQIPAKVYEYLRSRRPIFALTDINGDTARMLRSSGIDTIASWDDKDEIKRGLIAFLELTREGQAPVAGETVIAQYSRRVQTNDLSRLMESLA